MNADEYISSRGIEAVVVPMGAQAMDYPDLLRSLFRITNRHGALAQLRY